MLKAKILRRETLAVLLPLILIAGCDAARRDNVENTRREDLDSATVSPQASTEPVRARAATSGIPAFLEVRQSAGAGDYTNGAERNHFAILESLGGGVSLVDIDGDRYVDIVYPRGGLPGPETSRGNPNLALRNRGNLHFQDVSERSGLAAQTHYSHGALHCDVNQDGFADILITGYGGLSFFSNQGDGTYIETSRQCGLTDSSWSSSAACGDVTGDGVEDFYIACYVDWSLTNDPHCYADQVQDVCPPREFNGLSDLLLVSDGAGSFHDVSSTAGLRNDGKGLGVVMADLDVDGDLDIYVANDTVDNFLYENKGTGIFQEVGVASSTAYSERATPDGSMGTDVGDFNLDGWPDIWVTNYQSESPALYRNEQKLMFQHVSRPTGVKAIGSSFVGWGTLFFDPDRDGDQDIVISHGHVIRHPVQSEVRQRPALLENIDGKRLSNAADTCGGYFTQRHDGRGVAAADLDHDGDQDLVFSRINAPIAILENQLKNDSSWLAIRTVGTQSPRTGVGAVVTLFRQTSPDLVQHVRCGYGYASSSEQCLYFGIKEPMDVEHITINWPSGIVQKLVPASFNTFVTVIENRNHLYEERR